jgi:hypothetical protein
VAYFGENEIHEVFPIRRPEDHAQLTKSVGYILVVQIPFACQSQETMELVNGEHCGRRIVDGRRQRLKGDIDQDARRLLSCTGIIGGGSGKHRISATRAKFYDARWRWHL